MGQRCGVPYVEADGYVYVEITGAMYGLSASRYIANQDLQKHPAKYGITQQNEHQAYGNIKQNQSFSHL